VCIYILQATLLSVTSLCIVILMRCSCVFKPPVCGRREKCFCFIVKPERETFLLLNNYYYEISNKKEDEVGGERRHKTVFRGRTFFRHWSLGHEQFIQMSVDI
jgi:hypothetical protein